MKGVWNGSFQNSCMLHNPCINY